MPDKLRTHGQLKREALPARTHGTERIGHKLYGRRWRKVARAHLEREPLCRICAERGTIRQARDVDHITPRSAGGSDADDNLQSLCHRCHSAKTAQEAGRRPDGTWRRDRETGQGGGGRIPTG